MDTDNVERSLGRIEGKIDALCERMDRHSKGLFLLEARTRSVEADMRAAKTTAGVISFVVSLFTAIGHLILNRK